MTQVYDAMRMLTIKQQQEQATADAEPEEEAEEPEDGPDEKVDVQVSETAPLVQHLRLISFSLPCIYQVLWYATRSAFIRWASCAKS